MISLTLIRLLPSLILTFHITPSLVQIYHRFIIIVQFIVCVFDVFVCRFYFTTAWKWKGKIFVQFFIQFLYLHSHFTYRQWKEKLFYSFPARFSFLLLLFYPTLSTRSDLLDSFTWDLRVRPVRLANLLLNGHTIAHFETVVKNNSL